ncbi:MAG: histidinol phosphate phosphatase [Clostridia bacterium]|nr:histidinol phosphate phosphatase [Clostridia bacterium]
MWYADSHTHTEASEDSETPILQAVQAAAAKGLRFLTVTDHVEIVDFKEGAYDVAAEQSWHLMESFENPTDVRLLRGIELGEPAFDPALAERVLAAHPYDFVLASQHRVDDTRPDHYFIEYAAFSDREIEREMTRHFEETLRTVRWNGFDSLAHLTYPFRYLPEKWRQGDYRPWQGLIDDLLGLLAQNGKALEINTSGIRKGQGVTCPDRPLVTRFRELGGERITIGSDAHRPGETGADLDEGAAVARDAGFEEAVVYIARQPQSFAL